MAGPNDMSHNVYDSTGKTNPQRQQGNMHDPSLTLRVSWFARGATGPNLFRGGLGAGRLIPLSAKPIDE